MWLYIYNKYKEIITQCQTEKLGPL